MFLLMAAIMMATMVQAVSNPFGDIKTMPNMDKCEVLLLYLIFPYLLLRIVENVSLFKDNWKQNMDTNEYMGRRGLGMMLMDLDIVLKSLATFFYFRYFGIQLPVVLIRVSYLVAFFTQIASMLDQSTTAQLLRMINVVVIGSATSLISIADLLLGSLMILPTTLMTCVFLSSSPAGISGWCCPARPSNPRRLKTN